MRHKTTRAMRDALRGHPYVPVFVWLLSTVLALVAVSALSWCDCGCSCDGSSASPVQVATTRESRLEVNIFSLNNASNKILPGERVWESATGSWTGEPGTHPDHVILTYTPPAGATNLDFSVPPDEKREGGTYVWNNVSTHEFATGTPGYYVTDPIRVFYDAPLLPQGKTEMNITSTSSVTTADGTQHTASHTNLVEGLGKSSSALMASGGPADARPAPQTDDYYLWRFGTHSDVAGLRLTTELCEGWAAVTDPSKFFIGVRFPLLNATPPYTDSYSLPVMTTSAYSPTLRVQDERTWPSHTLLSVPLKYRPEYHTFLNAELPWKDTERWFALGVEPGTSIACPQGMDLPAGRWAILGDLWLDLGGQLDACANCILPVYLCYDGQQLPSLASVAARASGLAVSSYRGWGITCLGPVLVPIEDYSPPMPFYLYDTYSLVVTPTQQVRFSHQVYRGAGTVPQVTLSISSTLDASWGIYEAGHRPRPCGAGFGCAVGGRLGIAASADDVVPRPLSGGAKTVGRARSRPLRSRRPPKVCGKKLTPCPRLCAADGNGAASRGTDGCGVESSAG
jgi:hypothetical protein